MMPFLKINFLLWFNVCALTFTLAHSSLAADSPSDSYQKGNALYEAGKYEQASRLYLKAFQQGELSEELFYNLGNTFYKQEKFGEAALWYRRALILNPRMPEPRQNLRALKNRVGVLDFEIKGNEQVLTHFRESELITLLTICIWLSLLSLFSALFVRRLQTKRPLLFISCGLFSCLALTSAFAIKTYRTIIATDQRAVVTKPETIAQTGPVPDAKTVIELPLGTELRIVSKSGPWQYVDIPGDLRGWVRTDALRPLWPPNKETL